MDETFDIESLFNGLPDEEVPNNRPKQIIKQHFHLITVGAPCNNYFEVLFPYDDDISDISIIYRQSDTVYFIKKPSDIIQKENSFWVRVNLDPEETALFDHRLLDVLAQVKVTYWTKPVYTDIFKMKLLPILEEKN